MSAVRDRTVVADFSVLPERPKLDIVQRFVEKSLGLRPTDFRSIQLHNIRHCVLIEMADPTAAIKTATAHHLKHAFRINPTKKIAIPVYVDDDTVDVRIHDLPLDLPNIEIAKAMLHYGEVLTIRDEVWRNFFPGVPNGVRLLKMKLSIPVPSYITICKLTTLATHPGQIITCRRCGLERHVAKSCSEVAKKQPPKTQKESSAPGLPPATPTVDDSEVIASHTEDNGNDGFTTVVKRGKTKRQLTEEEEKSAEKRCCADDNNTPIPISGDEHCKDKGQRDTKQIENPTPKRRLPRPNV